MHYLLSQNHACPKLADPQSSPCRRVPPTLELRRLAACDAKSARNA